MTNFVEYAFKPVEMAIPRVLFTELSRRIAELRLQAPLEHAGQSGFELSSIAGIFDDSLPQATGQEGAGANLLADHYRHTGSQSF